MSDTTKVTDPVYIDYSELAETNPDRALDLLVWLFMDEELAAKRYAFLSALLARGDANVGVPATDEFESELAVIREHGVFHAVKDYSVSLGRLARMASLPDVLTATYEAFTGEEAAWLPKPQRTPKPAHLGKAIRISKALVGGGPKTEFFGGPPKNSLFGPSADRRDFLVSIPMGDLEGRCPFGIVIAECVSEAILARRILVLKQDAESGSLVGSMKAKHLLPEGRGAFKPDDVLDAYWIMTCDEFVALGLGVSDIDELIARNPGAVDGEARERLALLKTQIEEAANQQGHRQ